MKRDELVQYLDDYLRVREIADDSLNGLQVEGAEEVERVAFAVDARLSAFRQAAAWGAQLLVAHHGLFWGRPAPLVGPLYRRLRALVEAGLGLYAAHLPLDMHPEIGNNAEMVGLLGLRDCVAVGDYHGSTIGCGGQLPEAAPLDVLVDRIAAGTGHPVRRRIDGGRPAHRVACVSGGAASMAAEFAARGYDTYVTGEISHSSLPLMDELGINVIFAGHYASETLGVRALARHLAHKFRVETRFFELPTDA